jgi:hypothetical protein
MIKDEDHHMMQSNYQAKLTDGSRMEGSSFTYSRPNLENKIGFAVPVRLKDLETGKEFEMSMNAVSVGMAATNDMTTFQPSSGRWMVEEKDKERSGLGNVQSLVLTSSSKRKVVRLRVLFHNPLHMILIRSSHPDGETTET